MSDGPSALPLIPTLSQRERRILLFTLALIPAVIAVAQLGRIHPDEVYQTLEPAYFKAFGYGLLAWEWHQGIRNWAIPIFFSWLLKLCRTMGITNPIGYRAVLEIPQFLLHAWMLGAVFRYAERRVGTRWALLAMASVGLYGPILVFAGRTLGESFSAAFLVIALERLDRAEHRALHSLIAGLLMGAAIISRYGSVVFAGAALVWLLGSRRWREGLVAALGLALALAVLGLLDWATWGKPFHSFLAYFRFNVLSGGAVQAFGSAPATYYLPVLALAVPLWAWVGIAAAVKRQRPKIPCALFCAALYLVAISATPHKEERFLYPALVLFAFAAAPGIAHSLAAIRRPDLRGSLASLVLVLSFAPYVYATGLTAQRGDEFRAIVRAARPPDVTGLLILGDGLWGVGGYFYIGKNIPWLRADSAQEYGFQIAARDPRFNRVVTYDRIALSELLTAGFRVVDEVGQATILARP